MICLFSFFIASLLLILFALNSCDGKDMKQRVFVGRQLVDEWLRLSTPPWRKALHTGQYLTCPNCYNIIHPHGLCDLPFLFNSLFHDTTLNLARVHFESQHQQSGIYCLLVSVILHHSVHFVLI